MISTKFNTELDTDYVTIDKTKYSGKVEIDTILLTNFTVAFKSDFNVQGKGFELNW